MSVSTNLTRRGFIALASGLLVPTPERARAYSFGNLYENFVQLRDGRVIEALLLARCRVVRSPAFKPNIVGHPQAPHDPGFRKGELVVERDEEAWGCPDIPDSQIERVVMGGHDAWYDDEGVVVRTTYEEDGSGPFPVLYVGNVIRNTSFVSSGWWSPGSFEWRTPPV